MSAKILTKMNLLKLFLYDDAAIQWIQCRVIDYVMTTYYITL